MNSFTQIAVPAPGKEVQISQEEYDFLKKAFKDGRVILDMDVSHPRLGRDSAKKTYPFAVSVSQKQAKQIAYHIICDAAYFEETIHVIQQTDNTASGKYAAE